jgi:hypothetical protein
MKLIFFFLTGSTIWVPLNVKLVGSAYKPPFNLLAIMLLFDLATQVHSKQHTIPKDLRFLWFSKRESSCLLIHAMILIDILLAIMVHFHLEDTGMYSKQHTVNSFQYIWKPCNNMINCLWPGMGKSDLADCYLVDFALPICKFIDKWSKIISNNICLNHLKFPIKLPQISHWRRTFF